MLLQATSDYHYLLFVYPEVVSCSVQKPMVQPISAMVHIDLTCPPANVIAMTRHVRKSFYTVQI
jgi:hypothetical protein